MPLSDAQSTGLRDLSLCHWVVNVGGLSSGAPSQLEPLCRLGCNDATNVALKPQSMARVSLAATKGALRYVVSTRSLPAPARPLGTVGAFAHYQLIGPAGLSRVITRNEALQTVMQCAGSTLAERRPQVRASSLRTAPDEDADDVRLAASMY